MGDVSLRSNSKGLGQSASVGMHWQTVEWRWVGVNMKLTTNGIPLNIMARLK